MNLRSSVAPASWLLPLLVITACGAHAGRVAGERGAEVSVVWRACRPDTDKDSDHGSPPVYAVVEGALDGEGPVAIGRLPPCAIRQGVEGLWCQDPFHDGHFELALRRPEPGIIACWPNQRRPD